MTATTRRRAAGQWLAFLAIIVLVAGATLFLVSAVLVKSCACVTPPDRAGAPAAQAGRSA